MPLRLEDKKLIVEETVQVASRSCSVVAVHNGGLTAKEMTQFRALAREQKIYLRVIPNTLAKRALSGSSFECLQPSLEGPVMLAFSREELNGAAKLIRDFMKEHKKLEVKAIALEGRLFSAKELNVVASLPSRKEAIALFMSMMKAPVTKLVRTLQAPHTKLVRTLAALRDQKMSA